MSCSSVAMNTPSVVNVQLSQCEYRRDTCEPVVKEEWEILFFGYRLGQTEDNIAACECLFEWITRERPDPVTFSRSYMWVQHPGDLNAVTVAAKLKKKKKQMKLFINQRDVITFRSYLPTANREDK